MPGETSLLAEMWGSPDFHRNLVHFLNTDKCLLFRHQKQKWPDPLLGAATSFLCQLRFPTDDSFDVIFIIIRRLAPEPLPTQLYMMIFSKHQVQCASDTSHGLLLNKWIDYLGVILLIP